MKLNDPVTVEDAAAIIGCTKGRISQLVDEGKLEYEYLHGRALLIEKKSAQAYAKTPQKTGRPRIAAAG